MSKDIIATEIRNYINALPANYLSEAALINYNSEPYKNLIYSLFDKGLVELTKVPIISLSHEETQAYHKQSMPVYRAQWFRSGEYDRAVTIPDVGAMSPAKYLGTELLLGQGGTVFREMIHGYDGKMHSHDSEKTAVTLAMVWECFKKEFPTHHAYGEWMLTHFSIGFIDQLLGESIGDIAPDGFGRHDYSALPCFPVVSVDPYTAALRNHHIEVFNYILRRRSVVMHANGSTIFLRNPDIPADEQKVDLSEITNIPYEYLPYTHLDYLYKPLSAVAVNREYPNIPVWHYHPEGMAPASIQAVPDEHTDHR